MTKRQYYAQKIETKRSKTNENNTTRNTRDPDKLKPAFRYKQKKYHKIQSIIIIITTTFHCW